MLEPLLSMVVLTIVFGTLYGNTDKTFPVYILSGRLLYSFYSSATKAALKSIRSNAAMIKKVYVPKYLYPLSTVIYNYIIFLISLVVLAIVGVILGVLFFFNHFGHRKLTADPTPMQIQMRLYEDNVNTTIIEEADRRKNIDPLPNK